MTSSLQHTHQSSPFRILAIPELLDHIFAHIDHTTIRTTVVRVCRQWLSMNRDRIVRELLWDSGLPLEVLKRKMDTRIPRATHLYCYFRSGYQDGEKVDWLLGVLKQVHDEHQEHQRRLVQDPLKNNISEIRNDAPPGKGISVIDITPDLTARPLRELTLQGNVEVGKGVPGFLPFMTSLTRLTINQVCDSGFCMSQLLETCTQLEHLYIESVWTINLVGPWLPHRVSAIGNLSPPPPFPLKSLKLIHVQVPQPCLEMFLASTPYLQELMIVLREHVAADDNDLTRLCQLLQSLPALKLRSFHFSTVAGHQQTYDDYARMRDVCPQSTDWTVQGSDLSFDTSRLLFDNTNRITTLEVLGYTPYLHDLLCQLPHLLSVKAVTSGISYENLDVYSTFSRKAPTLQPVGAPPQPFSTYDPIRGDSIRVWACRGLQTCHLSFDEPGREQRASRILYGYLSRVCPRLRDLKICFPSVFLENGSDTSVKASLFLNLASGFCLLTRLKDLESLWIDQVDLSGLVLESCAIDWMAHSSSLSSASSVLGPSSSSSSSLTAASNHLSVWSQRKLSKRKRQVITAMWQESIDRDQSRIANNVARFEGMSPEEIRQKHDADLDVMLQLSSCGMLTDVKSVIDNIIDRDSQWHEPQQEPPIWPRLNRVAIYRTCGFGASPEAEVARLMAVSAHSMKKAEGLVPKKDGRWSWRKLMGI
ncbi:hypothetical protein K457DRAFT_28458 [Linnemannia elongata AG-77]|uniref:F-box domain-containing protein n=1 Tax=Linnemannia elongata AG-77 TaxID=1314771 RepID=A0A197KDV2_9FUNG|nr:hypothetical protein K457DRAFT_28458 [Linnemannia elongata AG-77]